MRMRSHRRNLTAAERGRRPSQQIRRSAARPARTQRADPLVAARWRAAHGHRCHAARTDHKGALAACVPAYRRDAHRHRCHAAQSPRFLLRTAGRPPWHAERTRVKQRRMLDPVRRQVAAFLNDSPREKQGATVQPCDCPPSTCAVAVLNVNDRVAVLGKTYRRGANG